MSTDTLPPQEPTMEVGRLALRAEGHWRIAYFAKSTSMLNATELGRIRLEAVLANDKLKQLFINTMREMLADMIEKISGVRPTWAKPESAPEHERSGNA